jgi:hypothetical protein
MSSPVGSPVRESRRRDATRRLTVALVAVGLVLHR